jgi:hypothetical protein
MSTLVTSNIKHGASGSNNVELDSSGNLKFNSGYGSPSVAYGCRAWVNFNGTGTVAIRASGNVSSITDNGTGNYRVNFTTAMVDANYSTVFGGGVSGTASWARTGDSGFTYTTTELQVVCTNTSSAATDHSNVSVAIFR